MKGNKTKENNMKRWEFNLKIEDKRVGLFIESLNKWVLDINPRKTKCYQSINLHWIDKSHLFPYLIRLFIKTLIYYN